MLKPSLFFRILWSRKTRYLLLSIWITLAFIMFFSLMFVAVQNYIPTSPPSFSSLTSKNVWKLFGETENIKQNILGNITENIQDKIQDNVPSNVEDNILRDGEDNTPQNIEEIIKRRNEEQGVRNLDLFGPITNDTVIIVIQTHVRKIYLQALIDSLKNTRHINESLLIFSHGYYDEDLNEMVEAIEFARVLQVFFPYSLQTHPNTFPGFSPGDCPHGVPELPKNCFGKVRDFKNLQVKHHWWWKINFVFNHLRITQDFSGLFLLLEEDHYVFPDIIYMLRLMRTASVTKCPDCNMFVMGQSPQKRGVHHYRGLSDKVCVQQWNNMGFAFTREFWQGLNQPKCKDMFCEYNDYNWDFTVAYLSHKCLPQRIKPLTVISPRVFHTGDCGIHFHGTNCERTKSLNETRDLQRLVAKFLFPPEVTVLNTIHFQWDVDGHNGGWDDPRDVQLCKTISRDPQ